jgi:Domain of unknown function (DUF4351)
MINEFLTLIIHQFKNDETVESLGKALLDFTGLDDVTAWLRSNR